MKKVKRGLSFSGGGPKGAWHVGVAKARMIDQGINYDAYSGNSSGALIASFLAQFNENQNVEAANALDEILLSFKRKNLCKHWLPFGPLHGLHKPSLFNSAPLDQYIHEHVSQEKIKASKKELYVLATSLKENEPHLFTHEDKEIVDAVVASASLPGVFLPKTIGQLGAFVDGGIYEMTPINALIKAGCTDIDISICYQPKKLKKLSDKDSSLKMIQQTLLFLRERWYWEDFKKAQMYNELIMASNGKHPSCKNKSLINFNVFMPNLSNDIDALEFGSSLDVNTKKMLELADLARKYVNLG